MSTLKTKIKGYHVLSAKLLIILIDHNLQGLSFETIDFYAKNQRLLSQNFLASFSRNGY